MTAESMTTILYLMLILGLFVGIVLGEKGGRK